ncbi:MAG: hypothetical protein V7L28_24820 [Nostoc sp.]
MTTTIAPNLGKFFTSCTKRPATAEDIALLAPDDWISERECPWSWQFKSSCQDMAVGVWEGKEFFVPHHLLMVCEIIEGRVVEKFFRKSEPKFKVGDRISILKTRTQNLSQWIGKTAIITAINSETISAAAGDGREKKHLTLKKGWYEVAPLELAENECTQQFKVGDRVRDIFNPRRPRTGTIADTPEIWVIVHWDGVKHSPNGQQWSYEYLEIIHEKFFMDESDEGESWNLAHFGSTPHQIEEDGQATIFYDTKGEPPEPDDFETIEEFEEAWKQWENSLQGIYSQDLAAIQKAQLPQDIDQCGRSKITPTPRLSTASDSQIPKSSNKTLPDLATNLSEVSTVSISSLGVAHALISALLANAPGLKELADNCFLNSSNSLKSSSLQLFFGNKFQQSYQVEKGKTLSKSLMRLQKWGMWGIGKCETETGMSPKTESDYSVWVFTGDIRATQPKPGKKSLTEIIGVGDAIVYRAAGGDRIYHEQAPCLRSPNNAGNGAYKIREYQGETYLERPINATEAEQLMGWEVGSTARGINKEGDEITISQTQRIKMIGNGIIPAEITDILTAIKPMLERKLESEVPENMRFAYRQLRQRGMSHSEAIATKLQAPTERR